MSLLSLINALTCIVALCTIGVLMVMLYDDNAVFWKATLVGGATVTAVNLGLALELFARRRMTNDHDTFADPFLTRRPIVRKRIVLTMLLCLSTGSLYLIV